MVEEVVLPDELDASFLHLSKLGRTRHTPYRRAPLVLREGKRQEGLLDRPLRLLLHFLSKLSCRLVHLFHRVL